jgi:hypothetical protein
MDSRVKSDQGSLEQKSVALAPLVKQTKIWIRNVRAWTGGAA